MNCCVVVGRSLQDQVLGTCARTHTRHTHTQRSLPTGHSRTHKTHRRQHKTHTPNARYQHDTVPHKHTQDIQTHTRTQTHRRAHFLLSRRSWTQSGTIHASSPTLLCCQHTALLLPHTRTHTYAHTQDIQTHTRNARYLSHTYTRHTRTQTHIFLSRRSWTQSGTIHASSPTFCLSEAMAMTNISLTWS